jgi:peptide/nickel transport system ATP-binding protein
MPDHSPLLSVNNLSVSFHTAAGRVRAVQNVSWSINRGETLAILGESGSGKSVSAAAVMGLIDTPPGDIESGTILFEGRDLLTTPAAERRRIYGRDMAMIFQDPLAALNPVYTVGWQIAEALHAHGHSREDARRETIALLERVEIPDAARRVDDYPHQFSGGQRQRVMIAMAVALKPKLLIADEPTTALDVTVQAQILKLLKQLQSETGMALLLITHDLGVVAQTADRLVVMKQGEVVETGTVRDVFRAPSHAYTRRLLDAVPGRGNFTHSAPARQPLLEVRGLSRYFNVTRGIMRNQTGMVLKAVDDVSFDLARGETVGVVGESGSGKSTMARVLLGLDPASRGTATFDGKSMLNLGRRDQLALRRRMQVVFQDPTSSLNPRMTIGEIIAEPWEIHRGIVARADQPARVAELLRKVELDPAAMSRYPHQFSGGQQQRIAIARALALEPDFIVCDEAVSALDVSIQAQIIELLQSLKRSLGLSYLFIAHDLPVVRDFADRVIVMWKGKIVEQGDTETVFTNPQHPYTQALLAASPDLDPALRPDWAQAKSNTSQPGSLT